MPKDDQPNYPDPREEDIVYGDRRISRPDASLPDWEMPDTAYRPIPIVWFTGAMLVELIVLSALAVLLANHSGWLAIALAGLATGAIGKWTWDRGMAGAGGGWKLATIMMLAIQFGFLAIAVAPGL